MLRELRANIDEHRWIVIAAEQRQAFMTVYAKLPRKIAAGENNIHIRHGRFISGSVTRDVRDGANAYTHMFRALG
jgi:hypothetical protein